MDGATAPDATSVRVRGIYATALTRRLDEAGYAVVQPSTPIRERFDRAFGREEYAVAVETTDDRQGVAVHGTPTAVGATADRLAGVEADAFAWTAALPRESVFVGRVAETLGSGAVVDCERGAGFLPYANTERHIEDGDRVCVQVSEPVPPWSDDRPVLNTQFEVGGGLMALVRDGSAGRPTRPGAAAELTDVLPNDPPDGWRARWTETDENASFDALGAALADANERASAIDAALSATDGDGGGEGDVRVRWSGRATAWVWFGRASRFALDAARRAVCPTMAGHHRIKAGGEGASAAVEFVEAVCGAAGTAESGFPFETVVRQFGPETGDGVRIGHGKPDGSRVVLGEGVVTDRDGASVTVRREMTPGGTYDALGVERRAGDVAITKFTEGKRWYPTVYRDVHGERRGTYVNVCTPVEVFPDAARYVDLYVDVVKHADGRVERVDDAELDAAVAEGHVSESLADTAREVAATLEDAL